MKAAGGRAVGGGTINVFVIFVSKKRRKNLAVSRRHLRAPCHTLVRRQEPKRAEGRRLLDQISICIGIPLEHVSSQRPGPRR